VPSSARALADLGWTAATPFDEGMGRYLAWIEEHGPH
jgi:nucleoside-diphosphate-sugar epimerase